MGTTLTMTGNDLASIANAMVGLYKAQYGRGPTNSKAYYANPDVLVVLLEGTLTATEQRLARLGELAHVRELRALIAYAAQPKFVHAIEVLTERKVRSHTSGVDVHNDMATEVFVLEEGS